MSGEHKPDLRGGNKALEYLVSHYQPMDAKLRGLIDSLPRFAHDLYSDAQYAASLCRLAVAQLDLWTE
jgi:hypothetical protein